MQETFAPNVVKELSRDNRVTQTEIRSSLTSIDLLEPLRGKKVAWVGDTNNISNELLVTLPRLGMKFALASPKGYDKVEDVVWSRVLVAMPIYVAGHADFAYSTEAGTEGMVTLTNSPEEALHDADVVITDTWSVRSTHAMKA